MPDDHVHPKDAHFALEPVGEALGGRLSRAGRLWVLESRGSARERGLQHGSLLTSQVRNGVVSRLARRALDLPDLARAHPAARTAIENHVEGLYAVVRQACPTYLRAEIDGLAEASGVSASDILRASFLSEVLQQLAAFRSSSAGTAVSHGACTAAVATSGAPGVRSTVHAKNQDYDGGGLWDAFPLVHIAHPDEGLAHVSATSVGLLKGNLTLNAAGVSIGGHFLFSTRAGRGGAGFTILEREVALRATSVQSAIDILSEPPLLGAFAFVIADAKDAVVAECDGSGVAVRRAKDGLLGMANVATANEDRVASDLLRRWGAHKNPWLRQCRVEALLAEPRGNDTVAALAHILADRMDLASGRSRGPAHVIAQPTTVTSAIAENLPRRFWVGESERPTSYGAFIGFDLSDAFSAGQTVRLCGSFSTQSDGENGRVAAFRRYLAADLAFSNGSVSDALELLAMAASLDEEEPAYPRFQARLAIRRGRWTEAEAALHRACALPQSLGEKAECHLLLGYAADLDGDRASALAAYRAVIEFTDAHLASPFDWVDPEVAAAARKRMDQPFGREDAEVLPVAFDLISGAA